MQKNIGVRRAISSGNIEELDIIWQFQIKDSMKSYLNLFQLLFNFFFHYVFHHINLHLKQT